MDRLGKALDIFGGNASNGYSAVLGCIDRMLMKSVWLGALGGSTDILC